MNINDAKGILGISHKVNDAVLMKGVHGIGKSQIVKEFAKENNLHLEELFLSHQEVGDLIGIPHIVQKNGVEITTWSQPIWLQRLYEAAALGKDCVLFLDELNRAQPEVLQSALQLVLERKLHEHALPTNNFKTMIISAINPEDEYQVTALDPALLSRFLVMTVEPDIKAFLSYCNETNVSPIIRDFLSENPQKLHDTPKVGIGSNPRAWVSLSNYVKIKDEIEPHQMINIIMGKIGNTIGGEFFKFLNEYDESITLDSVDEFVNKLSEVEDDIEVLSEKLKEFTKKQEIITKSEMLDNMTTRYRDSDVLVPLAYMYSVPLEILHSYIQRIKETETEYYLKIVELDSQINNKELFKRIVKKIKKG